MSNFLNRLNNSAFNNISAKDKRQILLILIILSTLIIANIIVRNISPSASDTEDYAADPEIAAKLAKLSQANTKTTDSPEAELAEFDPNTASKEELMAVGLSERLASNILKYRKKGGHFASAADMGKLYGMSESKLAQLTPYIRIANPESQGQLHKKQNGQHEQKKAGEKAAEYFYFDPNTISADSLILLGFSKKQADSFVNYRNRGKKFYVAADMLDAYSVDEARLQKIGKYVKINLDAITQGGLMRDINTIDKEGLMECGLSEEEAGKVLDFREKAGYFYAPWQIGDCLGNKRGNKLKEKFYVCRSVERRMLDIDHAKAESLEKNPYISAEQAARIAGLQKDEMPITKAMLVEHKIFNEQEMKRLANYLRQ